MCDFNEKHTLIPKMLDIEEKNLKNKNIYTREDSLSHQDLTYFKKVYKRHANFINY
jgi:hypothetical protein